MQQASNTAVADYEHNNDVIRASELRGVLLCGTWGQYYLTLHEVPCSIRNCIQQSLLRSNAKVSVAQNHSVQQLLPNMQTEQRIAKTKGYRS